MYYIVIPTYENHFVYNINFLESFEKYCLDKDNVIINFILNKHNINIFTENIRKFNNLFIKLHTLSELINNVDNIEEDDHPNKFSNKYCLQSMKKLFSYTMLSSLKRKKKIYFDFRENTYKDFIIPPYFAECLDKLILNKVTGIYNICSGLKIKVKAIAKRIIRGFGNGKNFFYNENNKNQSFSMSNKLIFKKIGISLSLNEIYDYCVKLGLRVKNE